MHALHRLAIHPFKRCPQRFMTLHQMGERRLQPRAVQWTFHHQHARHVVAYFCIFQLLQNQHPPLGWRDRIIRPALYRFDSCVRIFRQPFNRLRQPAHRRRFEDRLQRDLHVPFLVHPREQRHRTQRMASTLEEVIRRANPFHAKDVLPQLGQPSFHRRGWRFVRHTYGPLLRLRQRFAVELAIGRQRQFLQRDEVGRHHICRHFPRHILADCGRCYRFVGRIVRTQRFLSVLSLPNDHDCLSHRCMAEQHIFDFTRLNPVPPDFHLFVDSTQIFNRSVRQPSRQISCTVETATRYERVRSESLRRQFRSVHIPSGHSIAANHQFPWHADRLRLPSAIHNVNPRVRQRFSYWYVHLLPFDSMAGANDRSFCWPIRIPNCVALLLMGLHLVSARQQMPKRSILLVQHLLIDLWRQPAHCDPVLTVVST
ncbi:hypothetical protein PAECIP111893_02589 [Paenibacillus plantiphilus]|uniref:Uncharacterized protein n=1 Tax=Paenibacillus plantiphilus TaxID=2905650 RepID=A0ABM9CAQ0_9BACL|nr:hypothetical protein PAECIP111893_02589 [Paenibacillus plantiphilus]